ncbi:MAG: N-methyl-D-aspartate receptor NMDAR2C subunit [Pseudomonadota bacterium]
MMDPRTEAGWKSAWRALGVAAPDGLHVQLLAAWSEPQRHYHTLQHLGECLTLAEELRDGMDHPAEVVLALWFHDAVYDVRARDNEAQSAQWAVRVLREAGVAADARKRIENLIMATCHGAADAPASQDSAILIDIDLAILGSSKPRFAEYETQIRAEYAWVPPEIFAVKRREVLRGFLARERIYATGTMHTRYEAQARRNLSRAIGIA